MLRSKKATRATGLLIIAAGVTFLGFFALHARKNRGAELFNINKKTLAERLYADIVNYDFTADYPSAPEDVIEFNNNANLLLYGNMLTDNSLVGAILTQQRFLYDDELAESVTYAEQYDNLVKGLEGYKKNKTEVYDISCKSARRFDDRFSVVPVTWITNNMGEINWNYYLTRDGEGRYKIHSFEAVK